jgi:cell division protein ZapE
MALSVAAAYQQKLSAGEITPDAAQAQAIEALSRLEGELNALAEPGFTLPFFGKKKESPRGVYLWGPVGRGKSMLMDLFFDSAPVQRKRRVHFHAFMGETHRLVDIWRKGDAAARRETFPHSKVGGVRSGDDPIVAVAEKIAGETRLLCFDEFHVTDIADAMILGRLFEALFARGVTVVATSNRAPDALYRNGINRQLFEPFIDLIEARLEVVRVAGPKDFRLDRLRGGRVYFAPVNAETEAAFDALWKSLLDGSEETGATLEVQGRKLRLPHAAGGHLRSSFVSLCAQALGSQDYLALAARFHTVFLEDVPILTPDKRNEAARFVTLIDALYEAKAKLVVLAEAEPETLYPEGTGAFEFERTVSRLQEMRSETWIEAARDD